MDDCLLEVPLSTGLTVIFCCDHESRRLSDQCVHVNMVLKALGIPVNSAYCHFDHELDLWSQKVWKSSGTVMGEMSAPCSDYAWPFCKDGS